MKDPDLVFSAHQDILFNQGILTHASSYSVEETINRFEALLYQKGITLFAKIDHSEAAKKVGMSLPAMQLLIFGNPKAGTPIMLASPLAGLELPLKVLVWQDQKVWVSYQDPHVFKERFHLNEEQIQPLRTVEKWVIEVLG